MHSDLGKTLEVAQRYDDAKKEYEAGWGLLVRVCHASESSDARVRELKSSARRMGRACRVDGERRKCASHLANARRRLEKCRSGNNNGVDRDDAIRAVMSCLERWMRLERDALGENSYGCAKLRLKLAKAKVEGGDVEGGA